MDASASRSSSGSSTDQRAAAEAAKEMEATVQVDEEKGDNLDEEKQDENGQENLFTPPRDDDLEAKERATEEIQHVDEGQETSLVSTDEILPPDIQSGTPGTTSLISPPGTVEIDDTAQQQQDELEVIAGDEQPADTALVPVASTSPSPNTETAPVLNEDAGPSAVLESASLPDINEEAQAKEQVDSTELELPEEITVDSQDVKSIEEVESREDEQGVERIEATSDEAANAGQDDEIPPIEPIVPPQLDTTGTDAIEAVELPTTERVDEKMGSPSNIPEASNDIVAVNDPQMFQSEKSKEEEGEEAVAEVAAILEEEDASKKAQEVASAPAATASPNAETLAVLPEISQEKSAANDSVFASPATPKSALSVASVSNTSSANDPIVGQIALVLKINKELIRLCVDLQAKDLSSDHLFKDAALRLQSNLAFLASIADRSTKNNINGSATSEPPAAPLHSEAFPPTLHAPDSQLPKLYQLLSSMGASNSINSEQTKRPRSTSQDSQRKRSREQPPADLIQQQQKMQLPKQPMQINNETNARYPTPPQPYADTNGSTNNGMMPNVSNPAQVQSLTQTFGPNAVMNLNALQAHYRGQPQAVVSYMEANVPGFRTLPIQVQLQQMTAVQNAAMQRQRQQSQGPSSQQSTPPQSQQVQSRRTSIANAALQGRPGTPQSAFGQPMSSSPAPMTAASPASHLMPSPTSYPSPQQQQNQGGAASYASMQGAPNMPAHIQQHLLQQFQQQQLHNNQQMSNQFPPAPSTNQYNGLTWPSIQQPPS